MEAVHRHRLPLQRRATRRRCHLEGSGGVAHTPPGPCRDATMGSRWNSAQRGGGPVPDAALGHRLGLRRTGHRSPPDPFHAWTATRRTSTALEPHEIGSLLGAAESRLLAAVANDIGSPGAALRRHRSEQDLLCVRLAADSGARRGELAALRFDGTGGGWSRTDSSPGTPTVGNVGRSYRLGGVPADVSVIRDLEGGLETLRVLAVFSGANQLNEVENCGTSDPEGGHEGVLTVAEQDVLDSLGVCFERLGRRGVAVSSE